MCACFYFANTATKSRTGFCSLIEKALPFARLNQNALEEPPSRLSARWILKSGTATTARMFDKSARVTSEQKPTAALSPPTAANVRRAILVDSKPCTDFAASTIIGPHSTAASSFWLIENSDTREI